MKFYELSYEDIYKSFFSFLFGFKSLSLFLLSLCTLFTVIFERGNSVGYFLSDPASLKSSDFHLICMMLHEMLEQVSSVQKLTTIKVTDVKIS